MQENNLVNRINLVFTSLKSKEIIDFLNQWNIDKLKLLTLVIESKIGYDRLISDNECKKFIDDIEEHVVYTTAEYSELIMFISTMGDVNNKFNNGAAVLNKFQVFHKMLYKTGTLVLKLLNDKPVEAIPVVDKNSIVNPLFAQQPQQAQQFQQIQHVQQLQQVQPVAASAPVYDSKVFSITTPVQVEIPAAQNQSDEGEMSLSSFLKSLATG